MLFIFCLGGFFWDNEGSDTISVSVINFRGVMWKRNRKVEKTITYGPQRFTWFDFKPTSTGDGVE